jgi:exodeoxyribonuclease V gamma subunit
MNRNAGRSNTIDVWYSNQLEHLAGQLIKNMASPHESPVRRLFAMPPIIVPNRNIETYLKYEIARGAGIVAGLNFKVIDRFLESLLPAESDQGQAQKLVNPGALRAFFIDVLSQAPCVLPALPESVRSYIESGGLDEDARDLRRFQLASRLAQLTRLYGDTRPAWLRTWADGRPALHDGPMADTENWQRDLWARLVELVHGQVVGGTRWVLRSELFPLLEQTECLWPEEVHLFGFSYSSHGLPEMIERLSMQCKLNIYTFTLSAGSSEGLGAHGEARAAGRSGRPQKIDGARKPAEQITSLTELPVLDQWAEPGRAYFRMLSAIDGTTWHADIAPDQGSTVLRRLQREIWNGSLDVNHAIEPDESLSIVGCAGIRREAEAVANEIWRLVAADDDRSGFAPDRLRFSDIAVLLADRANQAVYQAHFRAVFDELHSIPFNMIELPLAGECRVIEGLLLLLALPLGEFTRPELLKILEHPAVRARFPEADTGRWHDWCLGLEIVRGADRLDHDGTYIDRELFHWEQGLKRLVLGVFMTGPQSGDDRAYRLGDLEYLPYDQPVDALADIGRLLALMRSLVLDARFARSARLTMTAWSAFFARMVSAYLAADTDAEERALSQCLQQIETLRALDVSGREVSYRIASECLREALEGLTGARGHYLVDGVVVSPILEMRSLPFRAIFVCGLGEGRFPAVTGPNPLDLTLAGRQPGDVSARERDKYLFLETVVCARERLYLSYVARDAQTGDEIEPSTVVHELILHLERGRPEGRLKSWVWAQPLRRFDDSYFKPCAGVTVPTAFHANFSSGAWHEWQGRELQASLRNHCGGLPRLTPEALRRLDPAVVDWLGLCPVVGAGPEALERVSLSFRDLLAFLRCPMQGWARFKLRLEQDDDVIEAMREDEPFVTGSLGETSLLRDVFFDVLGHPSRGPATDDFERLYTLHAESRARRGLIPIGLFGAAERRRHLACLANWNESARRRDLVGRCDFQVYRFGRAREDERVDRIESPIILDVSVPGHAHPVRVELFGRTELVMAELPASITPVVRDKAMEKDFLAGFLDAVVLSLLPGHHVPGEYHAHVIAGSDGADLSRSHRVFHGIDAVNARQFLMSLIADLLGGSHDYLLPCEAVFEYLSRNRSIESSVEEMKESESKSCSSRYGPVPNFEEYDAPGDDEARAIIDRRFGLFRESGGLGT